MEHMKTLPAPFEKGVNFTNWLEYRSAEQINGDMFGRQDFINARKMGCDVIRLPIHFEKICHFFIRTFTQIRTCVTKNY